MGRPPATAEGASATVLLLPSLGRGAKDFDDIRAGLHACGVEACAPDPLGLDDAMLLEGRDLADLARHAFSRAPDDGRPVVVAGHAFGSWVARMCAVLFPSRVKGVILLAASRRVIAPDIKASIDGSFDPELPVATRLAHLQRAYFAPGNDAGVWLEGWHPGLARAQRRAAARSDRAIWWSAGEHVPILDIQAACDRIAPFDRRFELRDEIGDRVVLEIIENAGHALLPERLDAVIDLVARYARRFLTEAKG